MLHKNKYNYKLIKLKIQINKYKNNLIISKIKKKNLIKFKMKIYNLKYLYNN